MSYPVGRIVLVRYDGFQEWHERMILMHVETSFYLIVTPDYDFFVEQLDLRNGDIDGLRQYGPGEVLPTGVAGNRIYAFAPLTAREIWDLLVEGRQLGLAERAARGIMGAVANLPPAPAAGGAPVRPHLAPGGSATIPQAAAGAAGGAGAGFAVPPPAAPAGPAVAGVGPAVAPLGGVWIVDEPSATLNVGDIVDLPPDVVMLQGRGLGTVANEVTLIRFLEAGTNINEYVAERKALLADDDRTLPVDSSRAAGSEVDLIKEMTHKESLTFPGLEGPRTADWLVSKIALSGAGGFIARHHRWVRESGISVTDRSTFEHQLLSKALEAAISIDRLNVKNLCIIEVLARRLQLIEEVISENPGAPNWEGATHYMGWADRKGGALLAPSLRTHVAKQLAEETATLKEKRKAREARGGKGNKKEEKEKGKD